MHGRSCSAQIARMEASCNDASFRQDSWLAPLTISSIPVVRASQAPAEAAASRPAPRRQRTRFACAELGVAALWLTIITLLVAVGIGGIHSEKVKKVMLDKFLGISAHDCQRLSCRRLHKCLRLKGHGCCVSACHVSNAETCTK